MYQSMWADVRAGFLRCHPAEGFFNFLYVRSLLILSVQNTQMSETKEFRRQYYYTSESQDGCQKLLRQPMTVSCYRGDVDAPKWREVDTRKSLI